MMKNILFKDIDIIKNIIFEAGEKIIDIYNNAYDYEVDYKEDDSPLTKADIASHNFIVSSLKKKFPEIPIISEENSNIEYSKRKYWELFWLVDPLDGTKEFIKRNGEFTINIALIEKNIPTAGFVYIPVKRVLYFAIKGDGAYKQSSDGVSKQIKVSDKSNDENVVIIKSRSHNSDKDKELENLFENPKIISAGSALKFCYVAEGIADLYIRGNGSMEWDTAAGQCVVECAGGEVYSFLLKKIVYNKKNFLNDYFFALGGNKEVNNVIFKYFEKNIIKEKR